MITLMSTNGQVQYDHDEWVVDKEEDLKLLPEKAVWEVSLLSYLPEKCI